MRDQDIALPDAGIGLAESKTGAPGGRPAGPSGSGELRPESRLYWLAARHMSGRPARWLTAAMMALAVLAAAAAVVSFSAQYRMVHRAKGAPAVAALEAAIPDVAALIFATLGIALALHGRRAVRARVLKVAAVGKSVGMKLLGARLG